MKINEKHPIIRFWPNYWVFFIIGVETDITTYTTKLEDL